MGGRQDFNPCVEALEMDLRPYKEAVLKTVVHPSKADFAARDMCCEEVA